MNEQRTESTTNVMDHTMDTVPTTTTTTTTEGQSLYERFASAISYIETEPDRAISTLLQIQEMVTMQSFFSTSSTSSETIDDISTSILPYLTLDHHLAMANVQIPVDRDRILTRQINLLRACDYFNAFLQKLESYDILTKEEQVQYQMLVEMTDHINDNNNHRDTNDGSANATTSSTTSSSSSSPLQTLLLPPPMNRDAKIAQYRQKQQLQQEQERLKSLQLRRRRLRATISEDEMMDGYDQESLIRTTNITAIYLTKMITYEEWSSLLQELPMISMMIQQQNDPLGSDDRYYHNDQGGSQPQQRQHDTRQAPKPMELTQITKDSTTGQLRVHRQEIQSKTFRPGWNQPTMSLEALAEREVHGAVQRQQQQEQSEAHNKTQPRRYEQLVKDGMEDNADLVEASAILDRNWDTFKDDNPRGCGNKRGDVGDRNF